MPAAWVSLQPLDKRVAAVNRTHQVDIEHAPPLVDRKLADFARRANPRVVDQQIEVIGLGFEPLGKRFPLVKLSDVETMDKAVSASAPHERKRLLRAGRVNIA